MTYNVKPIESLEPDRNWYEVSDAEKPFHLWIVEHDPLTDHLDCTCEAGEWCSHRAATIAEITSSDYQAEQADAIARRHGQY